MSETRQWSPLGMHVVVLSEERGGYRHAWGVSRAGREWVFEHVCDVPSPEHTRVYFARRAEVEAARFALGVIEREMRAAGVWDEGAGPVRSHADEIEQLTRGARP